MPTLSEKLKSLGVKVGAQDLPPPRPRLSPNSLEQVLAGQSFHTQLGETFLVEARYPPEYRHGAQGLICTAPLMNLAAWADEQRICAYPLESFAFLDTETSGLSGGTGTYAFLVGIGRFEGEEFHLAQFFMRDPIEEPAQLAALEAFLVPCQALVTFNGKAFDVPILNTRFITHGWQTPFLETAHIDLLHLARRLWRDRLPSRTLGNLEHHILGTQRTEEDVPGWMVPQLYFEYLHTGDPHPLKSVFYHNAMDVLSLAALFNHTAAILADPFNGRVESGIDIVALAKLFEDLGDLEAAARLYLHGLELDLPQTTLLEALNRMALLYKRQDNISNAIQLWEQAARNAHLEAHIELAKCYEHRLRNPRMALYWTQTAIELVATGPLDPYEKRMQLAELEHRKNRLVRRLANLPETYRPD